MTVRDRMIQRLDARGKLSVTLDLRAKVLRRYTDGHTEVTEWSDTPTPVWTVHLGRPYKHGDWAMRFFMDAIGWEHVHVEDEDLDAALAQALDKSEPRRVWLDERVWEHEDFKRACWLADQFQPAMVAASLGAGQGDHGTD